MAIEEHRYPPRDWAGEPRPDDPGYRSTALRAPSHDPVAIPLTLSEITGPGALPTELDPIEADLTANAGTDGEPIGERIIVRGRVLDEGGNALPDTLVEIWQANAAGRYRHQVDQHRAPIDPHFIGAGRCLTDADGVYRFLTIRPGAYPWANDVNAWRPSHLHFSLLGLALPSRLVTQMYFPGDPLHAQDAILNAVPRRGAPAPNRELRSRSLRIRMGARLPMGHRPAGIQDDAGDGLKRAVSGARFSGW